LRPLLLLSANGQLIAADSPAGRIAPWAPGSVPRQRAINRPCDMIETATTDANGGSDTCNESPC
jgi:hypothetical protein